MAAAWLASGGKLPFGVKPATPTINRPHPLANGLVFDANYFAPGLGGNIERVGLTPRSTYTATTTSIGPHGVARTFPGAAATDIDTYVTNAAVNGHQRVTWEFLFKPTGPTASPGGRIFHKGASATRRMDTQWDDVLENFFVVAGFSTTNGTFTTANGSVPVGSWYHTVVTYDFGSTSNVPIVYINGVPQTITVSTAPVGTATADTAEMVIGNRPAANRCVGADISHVRLWNRMLSASEAVQLYADPFAMYAPPKRRALTLVPTGTQTLTPSLFTNSSAFYAPTVTPGAVTLTPALFTNTSVFYSPTVSQAGTQTLTPSLFTNTNVFYTPTVTPGAVTLTPGLFTNSSTFYSPTVSRGTITLTPSLFTNTSSFYAPTVTRGTVTLTPALFTNVSVFYSPTVAQAGLQTLTPSRFDNDNTFYSPTITGGEETDIPDDRSITALVEDRTITARAEDRSIAAVARDQTITSAVETRSIAGRY